MRSLLGTMDAIHGKTDTLIAVAGDIIEAIGSLRTDVQREATAQQTAGDLRGQLVRSQVEGALQQHNARLDAAAADVQRLTNTSPGAPWRIVYLLLGANAVGALGFLALLLLLLHLYSQVTGSDPEAAFRDTRDLLPAVTGQYPPAGATPAKAPPKDPP